MARQCRKHMANCCKEYAQVVSSLSAPPMLCYMHEAMTSMTIWLLCRPGMYVRGVIAEKHRPHDPNLPAVSSSYVHVVMYQVQYRIQNLI